MKKSARWALLLSLLCLPLLSAAQCMYYPVPLQERVDHAQAIVLGKVVSQHSYWDAEHKNIYTQYRFHIDAWLKGRTPATEVSVITIGGIVGNDAQETYPALRLYDYNEYILCLEGDNHEIDDKALRAAEPQLMQSLVYADQQGALVRQFGIYHDHMQLFDPMPEDAMLAMLKNMTGNLPVGTDGLPFAARPWTPPAAAKTAMPITNFTPNPTNAGTIVPGDFITITGSGFGAAAGTVFYSNADDGGATFTSSGVATDNTAWSDVSITNKPAANAGTGPININGAMTSGSSLTINYAHTAVNSNFSGFASSTRQRYYHRNMNGAGGMYFVYNNAVGNMAGNAPARAAFERALETWRCQTFINWFSNGTTATGFGNDNENVVLFDGTLPAGVLGRATSRFTGSAGGACTLANTVWCVEEIDVQMKTDPPSVGFPWEYGPGAPAFSEYDFESVALHEMGHGHGLQHRIAAGQCMHFSITNGASIRTLNVNEITGGTVRMAYSSVATCLNPAGCGTGAMTLLTAGTCTLPVEYVQFTGTYRPQLGNVLRWTTTGEINNAGFFIERSADGTNFSSIGFLASKAESYAGGADYTFTDDLPELPVRTWYRLQQLDHNGNTAYSSIVEIVRPEAPALRVLQESGSGDVLLQVTAAGDQGSFVLYDLQGRRIWEQRLTEGRYRIPASSLAAGQYLWQAITTTGVQNGKVQIVP